MAKKFNAEFRVGQGGILEVSADKVLPTDAFLVLVDASAGPVTVTLQRADGFGGKRFCVKKIDNSVNAVTTVPIAGQTIDGLSSVVLSAEGEEIELISDNENYLSIGIATGPTISLVKSFLSAKMSVDQNLPGAATSIEFDTIDAVRGTNISLAIATFLFTLKAGKTYKLMGATTPINAAGRGIYQWHDLTNAVFIGTEGIAQTTTDLANDGSQPIAFAIVSPVTDIVLNLETIGATGAISYDSLKSFVFIEEI